MFLFREMNDRASISALSPSKKVYRHHYLKAVRDHQTKTKNWESELILESLSGKMVDSLVPTFSLNLLFRPPLLHLHFGGTTGSKAHGNPDLANCVNLPDNLQGYFNETG
jgi:hypothetical protein